VIIIGKLGMILNDLCLILCSCDSNWLVEAMILSSKLSVKDI
jgi:hypothetical protein